MNEVLYNSRGELDKLPFGAVTAGTKVRFGIRIAENSAPESVSLVVIRDEDGETQRFLLELVWCEKGYARFEGSAGFEACGLYWYYFEAAVSGKPRSIEKTGDGAAFTDFSPRPWQLTVYSPDYTTPEWIRGGVFYHIFVDRFNKAGALPQKKGAIQRNGWGEIPYYKPDENGEILNNDFFGGNLDGITEKLPYLRELGVSCIYLSPIFEAASNHKYDTGDYLRVDPAFGDDDSFKRLCDEAKQLEIRIILDGVFNHTGADSRYFNSSGNYNELGAYQSKASKYYDWYSFTGYPEEYVAWWGIKTLPTVRKDSEGFRSLIFGENGVLRKWISLGAYGWRLDVADELPDSFLEQLRETVKSTNPQALIIGEVWEDASNKIAYGRRRHYFEGRQLDSVMNYPLKNAIIEYVTSGLAEALCETVESICENYPKPAQDCLMNVLGTHDTARIITVLGGRDYETRDEKALAVLAGDELCAAKARLRLASVLQFTLPGVPCIYYADEAGLQGCEDPFNRRCYPWGNEDSELLQWYAALANARRSCKAFKDGGYHTKTAKNGVYIFTRRNTDSCALTAINLGRQDISLELSNKDSVLICYNCRREAAAIAIKPKGCAVIELY